MNDDFIFEFLLGQRAVPQNTRIFSYSSPLMIGNTESIPNHSFPKHKIKSSQMICFICLCPLNIWKNINQHFQIGKKYY